MNIAVLRADQLAYLSINIGTQHQLKGNVGEEDGSCRHHLLRGLWHRSRRVHVRACSGVRPASHSRDRRAVRKQCRRRILNPPIAV